MVRTVKDVTCIWICFFLAIFKNVEVVKENISIELHEAKKKKTKETEEKLPSGAEID